MINPEAGKKVPIMVHVSERQRDRLDEIAAKEAPEGTEPNRSKVIRRMVSEGIERWEEAKR